MHSPNPPSVCPAYCAARLLRERGPSRGHWSRSRRDQAPGPDGKLGYRQLFHVAGDLGFRHHRRLRNSGLQQLRGERQLQLPSNKCPVLCGRGLSMFRWRRNVGHVLLASHLGPVGDAEFRGRILVSCLPLLPQLRIPKFRPGKVLPAMRPQATHSPRRSLACASSPPQTSDSPSLKRRAARLY